MNLMKKLVVYPLIVSITILNSIAQKDIYEDKTTNCKINSDGIQFCTTTIPHQKNPNESPNLYCNLFMAPTNTSGFGLFTTLDYKKRRYIPPSDIVIHMVNPPPYETASNGLKLLLKNYLWQGSETGGQYEARRVVSFWPGFGMLANSHLQKFNLLPYKADVNEADLARTNEPGAGASSHYYNLTFFSSRTIKQGEELLVNYGPSWWHLHSHEYQQKKKKLSTGRKFPVEYLKRNGVCMDHLHPQRSKISSAGRGAFSTRFLPKDMVITSSPLAILSRTDMIWKDQNRSGIQLLLNYCYGHPNSTVLLFPYANVVNYINHAPSKAQVNVQIRWNPTHNENQILNQLTPKQLLHYLQSQDDFGLLIDYVALRDIFPGEEIYLDYGPNWIETWEKHVQKWKPVPHAHKYTPSYVMDDVASIVRTEEEQIYHPYPSNLLLTCFYKYNPQDAQKQIHPSHDVTSKNPKIVTIPWNLTKGVYDFENLHPCTIISRFETTTKNKFYYTVKILNRPHSNIEIPKNYLVSNVPRSAIRFKDRWYTTDQFLKGTFRKSSGAMEYLWPKQWLDKI